MVSQPLILGVITLPEHLSYFESVQQNNASAVEAKLSSANGKEKHRLLNGRFQFYDIASLATTRPHLRQCSVTRPFIIAAAYGSLAVCDVMIQHGVDACAVEPEDLLNVVHCLVGVAVYEPRLEATLIDSYKHLCRTLPNNALRKLLEMENREGYRPLEFSIQQGTLGLMAAIFDTPDVYLVRQSTIGGTIYRWYDITDYETPTGTPLSSNSNFLLAEPATRPVIKKSASDSEQQFKVSPECNEKRSTEEEKKEEKTEEPWTVQEENDIEIIDIGTKIPQTEQDDEDAIEIINGQTEDLRSESSDVPLAKLNTYCRSNMKESQNDVPPNVAPLQNFIDHPSRGRKNRSPMLIMLFLDERHVQEASRIFKDRGWWLRDWYERSIRTRLHMFTVVFLIRLLHIVLLYVYEMDEHWLRRIGGLTEQEYNMTMTSRSSSGNSTDQSELFIYCDGMSAMSLPPGVLSALGVYLLLYWSVCLLLFVFESFSFFTDTNFTRMASDLKGTKKMIISISRSMDKIFEFLTPPLVLAQLLILRSNEHRGDFLLALGLLRLAVTLLVLWNLVVYMQARLNYFVYLELLPMFGHIVIYVREMRADLFAFVLMMAFYNALFAHHFMIFFNVNSRQGCIPDFSSFWAFTYTMFLTMLNMEDFTKFDVEDHLMVFLSHYAHVTAVGILLLNLVIAVFSNTLARVNKYGEVIISLSRLVVMLDLDYTWSSLPLLSRYYGRFYSSTVARCFVCERGRVLLVCAQSVEHLRPASDPSGNGHNGSASKTSG